MKDFKDIQEGLLRGMEDTLDAGENTAQQVLKDQMMKCFVTNNSRIRTMLKEQHSFMWLSDIDDLDRTIDEICTYDGTVLTIDLTKSKEDTRLKMYIFNGGSDLPMIKIIDKYSLSIKSPDPDLCNMCNVIISSMDHKAVDVESFIHPGTNISSIAYDRNGTIINTFKSNVFPGTVRDLAAYHCKFEHTNKKAWPKCKLWFAQNMLIDAFMLSIEKSGSKYDLGYPSRNILIY